MGSRIKTANKTKNKRKKGNILKNMRKVSYLSVILFLIALWFTAFFFWNFIENNNYVSSIIRAGDLTFRGNEYRVISYYMSSSAPYAFYALTTGVLGWVLIKIRQKRLTGAGEITE
jgi:flagellar biosynthesis protein FlhB